jgi:hypothetical protein
MVELLEAVTINDVMARATINAYLLLFMVDSGTNLEAHVSEVSFK